MGKEGAALGLCAGFPWRAVGRKDRAESLLLAICRRPAEGQSLESDASDSRYVA